VKDQVYWTKKKLRIPKGELLWSDGTSYARARCGNRLSDQPHDPPAAAEPEEAVLSLPLFRPEMWAKQFDRAAAAEWGMGRDDAEREGGGCTQWICSDSGAYRAAVGTWTGESYCYASDSAYSGSATQRFQCAGTWQRTLSVLSSAGGFALGDLEILSERTGGER